MRVPRRLTLILVLALTTSLVVSGSALAKPPWAGMGRDGLFNFMEKHQARMEWRLQKALRAMESCMGYRDMDGAAWAGPHVARATLRGLLRGRGNGRFAPNDVMHKAEVIVVAIRIMGLEDELEDLPIEDLGHGLAFNIRSAPWAAGYLFLAVEHDLIPNSSSFAPNSAAQREWAVGVLTKAFSQSEDYDLELITDDDDIDDILSQFTDEDLISPVYRSAMATAVDLGWLCGYGDGTIKPLKPLTRAEFATILCRMEADSGEDDEDVLSWKGIVQDIDYDDFTLEILEEDEDDPVEVDLGDCDDIVVYINWSARAYDFEDIDVGDHVEVFVVDGHATIFVTYEEDEIGGTVVSFTAPDEDEDGELTIIPDGEEDEMTFVVTYDTEIRGDGLFPGDYVEVTAHGDVALKIEVEDRPEVTGIVLSVDDDELLVEADDETLEFELDAGTEFVGFAYEGKTGLAALTALVDDDYVVEVEVQCAGDLALIVKLEDLDEAEIAGTVVAFDPPDGDEDGLIAIIPEGEEDEATFIVTSETEIEGGPILPGDSVEIILHGDVAVEIEVEDRPEVTGTVTSHVYGEITIESDGDILEFEIDGDTVFENFVYQGEHGSAALAALLEDDWVVEVEITYVGDLALTVKLEDLSRDEGKEQVVEDAVFVSLLYRQGDPFKIVTNKGTFRLAEEVEVFYIDEDTEWDLEDLEVPDVLTLTLEDGRVVTIVVAER